MKHRNESETRTNRMEKQVKVIKRSERELCTLRTQPATVGPRTSAQVQREIVLVITSWIDEKKRAEASRKYGLNVAR